jgi:choline dehydrogenase-like flavoprotein
MAAMVSISEDLPQKDNRIVVTGERDRFGMPLAKSVYRISNTGRALTEQAAKEGLEIFRAAGAGDTWHGPTGGQHIMGGTIMGKDAATSVTDEFARVHGIDNLVVGGGSVFPTSSAVNSTFTIHAVSMRSALQMASAI